MTTTPQHTHSATDDLPDSQLPESPIPESSTPAPLQTSPIREPLPEDQPRDTREESEDELAGPAPATSIAPPCTQTTGQGTSTTN